MGFTHTKHKKQPLKPSAHSRIELHSHSIAHPPWNYSNDVRVLRAGMGYARSRHIRHESRKNLQLGERRYKLVQLLQYDFFRWSYMNGHLPFLPPPTYLNVRSFPFPLFPSVRKRLSSGQYINHARDAPSRPFSLPSSFPRTARDIASNLVSPPFYSPLSSDMAFLCLSFCNVFSFFMLCSFHMITTRGPSGRRRLGPWTA